MSTVDKNEESLRVAFQKIAQADDAPVVIKSLLKKADKRNMSLLGYITETGPEIREILDRMLMAGAKYQVEKGEITH